MSVCLLIGYGNTVRGDDGLGPYVARHFQDWSAPPGVRILVEELPQLDVALIEQLAAAQLAIFVDARDDDRCDAVIVERHVLADAAATPRHTSHSVGIDQLLRAARDWYGRAPVCYAVMPKGYEFEFSERLTTRAEQNAERAIREVATIINRIAREAGDDRCSVE